MRTDGQQELLILATVTPTFLLLVSHVRIHLWQRQLCILYRAISPSAFLLLTGLHQKSTCQRTKISAENETILKIN